VESLYKSASSLLKVWSALNQITTFFSFKDGNMVEESLAGKIAIVSGSAKGIGAATCVELVTRQVFGFLGIRNK
jgi:hypothetical protein